MFAECKIVPVCPEGPLLSFKWRSSSHTGPGSVVLVVLAVLCPREPDWAWLAKRLPFGTAAGVGGYIDSKLHRWFWFRVGLFFLFGLVFRKVRAKKLQHGRIGFIIQWQLWF